MARSHRPLVITTSDRILIDGRFIHEAGLKEVESLIREGHGLVEALVIYDDNHARDPRGRVPQ